MKDSNDKLSEQEKVGSASDLANFASALLNPSAAWMNDGLCAHSDSEAFFPDKGVLSDEAAFICGECPVKEICFQYAMTNGIEYGVWGGVSERERNRLRRAV
ncbi:MAG: WhiB family transcriptional regulator [Bifidobacteriaceae bacterium]|jgi:WhiB family redox-sensing transcriptional regulator|nr:WhiB family transcriptional regulator [Bifidobacteriaceae bacterium]